MVDVSVLALWAHPRSISTAFLRMMIERGDVTVVHEPLVLLTDHGAVRVPEPGGGSSPVSTPGDLLDRLAALGEEGPVFFKDTLEYRYRYLFEHPERIAGLIHTFIVRDPARAIASHYAVKPEMACREAGYEHQWELFELAWRATGNRPLVISADRLLADPPGQIAAWCAEVALPFLPGALRWQPGERTEWQPNRRWHQDASISSTFRAPERSYPVTIHNNARLHAYYTHHLPFYRRLVQYAL